MQKEKKSYDLTTGPILNKLVILAMPLMGNAFMQMAFNLSDMFWVSSLADEAVAAVGTAGMYLWLSFAFVLIGRMGAEIGVSQMIGKNDIEGAKKYAQNAFIVALFLGVTYSVLVSVFRTELIGFFGIEDKIVVHWGEQYLFISALSFPFFFINNVITGVFNGYGNTKLPFLINSFGLVLNIVLTPVFIFVFEMGVVGAAVGTVVAQVINVVLKIWAIKYYKNRPFEKYSFFAPLEKKYVKQIFKWGTPVAIESALFTLLFMIVSRRVADFGVGALSAQRVGAQVESLSWMISGGFSSAVTAFVGQNYGAKKYDRLNEGYKISMIVMGAYGVFATFVLVVFANPLISIFLDNPEYIAFGVSYLRIFGIFQIVNCMEAVAIGAFRGKGLTTKPTIVSVVSNILRVVLAYAFAATHLGLIGVFVGSAIATTIRSIWAIIWYKLHSAKTTNLADCA